MPQKRRRRATFCINLFDGKDSVIHQSHEKIGLEGFNTLELFLLLLSRFRGSLV